MSCEYLKIGMQYWSNNDVWRIDIVDKCNIFSKNSNIIGRVYPKDYEKVLSILGYPTESLFRFNWDSVVSRIKLPILRQYVEVY